MNIPYRPADPQGKDLSSSFTDLPKHRIGVLNWSDFTYSPYVEFSAAWSDKYIFIKYVVEESATMAATIHDNGPVWKDSCVEFFVSPDHNDYYYNFEFNCIGACLLAYGNSRNSREYAPPRILPGIIRIPSLERKIFPEINGKIRWELAVAIPETAFFRHPEFRIGPKTMKGNFYKCGDGLSTPHYLSWKPVHTPRPDFHRPDFFHPLDFIKTK